MKTYFYTSVAARQVSIVTLELKKLEVTMNSSANPNLYLQIHDSRVTPADGAVPLHSWLASDCGFKDFKIGELKVGKGLYIGLSTTAATLTKASGASNIMDLLNIETAVPFFPDNVTSTGNLTSGFITAWADAQAGSARRLIAIDVANTGGVKYLQVFAKASPSASDVPVMEWTIPATGSTPPNLEFGAAGVPVKSQDADGTKHYGCYLAVSTTQGVYTADNSGLVTVNGIFN